MHGVGGLDRTHRTAVQWQSTRGPGWKAQCSPRGMAMLRWHLLMTPATGGSWTPCSGITSQTANLVPEVSPCPRSGCPGGTAIDTAPCSRSGVMKPSGPLARGCIASSALQPPKDHDVPGAQDTPVQPPASAGLSDLCDGLEQTQQSHAFTVSQIFLTQSENGLAQGYLPPHCLPAR